MKKTSKLKYVNIDDLLLDLSNPRFAELYSGSSNEDDVIEYLLFNEAAKDVAEAIVRADEFYEDKALWVIEAQDGKYLVKDGNRRCAAVKALQMPGKFKLKLEKTTMTELPVYVYDDLNELDSRIVEEHAGSLFRRWERIAKALEVYKLFSKGVKVDSMIEIDSNPADLIRLASFYYEAVKVGGDDLRKLLRRGRGKDSGKTIIFERLFKYADNCGYHFKRKPVYLINIDDRIRFNSYIKAVVDYLLETKKNITTDFIDKQYKEFFDDLVDYGFDINSKKTIPSPTPNPDDSPRPANGGTSSPGTSPSTADGNPIANPLPVSGRGGSKRGSIKKYPNIRRKQLPPGLKQRIDEYYKVLDSAVAPNAKIAMGRVLFECVMKFVVEETKYNGKTFMSKAGYFGPVYADSKYTDFKKMRQKFIDLIKPTKERNAMISFDLENLHQIVHNYLVNGVSPVGDQIASNLLELIEFMLQDESDLLHSLDLTKIK